MDKVYFNMIVRVAKSIAGLTPLHMSYGFNDGTIILFLSKSNYHRLFRSKAFNVALKKVVQSSNDVVYRDVKHIGDVRGGLYSFEFDLKASKEDAEAIMKKLGFVFLETF